MSVMAGLLGFCLEKPGHYRLGEGLRAPEPADIGRAVRIVNRTAVLAVVVSLGVLGRARRDHRLTGQRRPTCLRCTAGFDTAELRAANLTRDEVLDFSSNINPLGPSRWHDCRLGRRVCDDRTTATPSTEANRLAGYYDLSLPSFRALMLTGTPATIRITSSAAAAKIWLTRPSSSA